MAGRTAEYVLIAVLAIPAATLAVLMIVANFIATWYELILPVFAIYFFSFVASVAARKWCNKKTGNWRKALGFLLLKTVLFTFGIIGAICYMVAGETALVSIDGGYVVFNIIYAIVLLVAWIIMAGINEIMIK